MLRFFLERNHILTGIIAGVLIPFVGYAVFLMIFEQLESVGLMSQEGLAPRFRERTCALIAICLNIFPMNYYRKKYFYESMRGLVFPTMIYVAAWVLIFWSSLFGS
jgi:hypothetical protein